MKRHILIAIAIFTVSLLIFTFAEDATPLFSSSGPREWLDGTEITADMLLTTLTIQDVPGGTFRLTSAGHNDFSFNVELHDPSDSFIIEIWRDCGGKILKSQTETIHVDHVRFSVYDVKDGETIFWRNLNLDGGACTVTFDLVIIDDAASGTPAPAPQTETTPGPSPAYRVGASVTLGVYPQAIGQYDKFMDNDIEWIILDVQGENALLISKYGLDTRRYHYDKRDTTWENCSLRQWLNGDFYQTAFRKTEKQYILTTAVSADENPEWESDPGRATKDKVFLLSVEEVYRYLPNPVDRLCSPTDYAKFLGAFHNAEGNGWWWLRTTGRLQSSGTDVNSNGTLEPSGDPVNSQKGMVRPCIWVKIH